jgi:hypothetical protein
MDSVRSGGAAPAERTAPPPPPPALRALLRGVLLLLVAAAIDGPSAHGAPAPPPRRPPAGPMPIHTVFLTDCTAYSDWQTLVMVFGWRASGQPGPLTRVMCCTPEERAAYRNDMLGLVPTHVAPSFASDPRSGDEYAAYNKPGGIIDWLKHAEPDHEWVLVLDSDMILRRPFAVPEFNLSRGWASGARYDYLIGVDNALAERHIPEVPKRADALAGPQGRRADRIGGFYLIHRDDLRKVAPLWLKYAEDVRADPEVRRGSGRGRPGGPGRGHLGRGGGPRGVNSMRLRLPPLLPLPHAPAAPRAPQAWHLSGDFYSKKKGDKPWISEMYGYVFGAAKLGIRHRWDEQSMIYPGYRPTGGGRARLARCARQ